TTTFSEGNTMTKAAGVANCIIAPNVAGEYKLYIQYGDGRATATSKYTVYVGQSAAAVNVNDGDQYEGSAVRPPELTLGAGYTF
ncbi:hypothetical protein, partial [Cohnella sp. GbtcB17]|uniref:hypothetical protein n=1 Tax=Cohnella sp. GbtcB17 TaxID=2824762 RepID=UPI001C2FBD9C